MRSPTFHSFTLLILACTGSLAQAQDQVIAFRASYSDFRFDEVAQSFTTQGGNIVEVVKDRFAGDGGLGGDYVYISEDGRFMGVVGAEYISSNLFGGGGFKIRYSPSDNPTFPGEPSQAQEFTVSDQTAYFRSIVGVGMNVFPKGSFFMYLNPNLDIQYGQRAFLEDAYAAFVERGYSVPTDFKVENSMMLGVAARLHTGFWLSEEVGLAFSPEFSWSNRFSETFTGYEYSGVESQGSSWGYGFTFGLLVKVASADSDVY